jgi:hypothetical protein
MNLFLRILQVIIIACIFYKVLESISNRFCAQFSDKTRVSDLPNQTVRF